MGRIADALKKAEDERRFARRLPGGAATLLQEPPRSLESARSFDLPKTEEPIASPKALVEGLSEALVPFCDRTALVTEQYRSLRTHLLSQNPNYEHRILAITSAIPREGKSVTSLNLGCVLAEIRHLKVLVVDGDFRRGSLARMLNQPESPGLADVLAGQATYQEALRDTPVPNLRFMATGDTRQRSAAELLTSANTEATFHRMRTEFHYTIVDTPPATTVSDVGIIGQMCSGVILVVRLHRTAELAAKRAVRLLQVNSIPIVGCLLIGRDPPGGRYGYGFSYYRYDHDYKDYVKGPPQPARLRKDCPG